MPFQAIEDADAAEQSDDTTASLLYLAVCGVALFSAGVILGVALHPTLMPLLLSAKP